ncbi:hypothetical protein [Actinomadura opuntiae]|uniref:hypothetical protein n=1 Tax=Actinomadura sp. OS1-43 TaxID=604315 RepID=UPI00255A7559|nr:hypothetical protein [Actinomadura sp. OS1-43]MDL4817985.1 hypothetical protein [Actinomadura sp. OS1-43]
MDIEDLSDAERVIWDAFPRAGKVDLTGTGEAVRGEVLAALLLGARPADAGQVPALRLTGARISGVLDLSFAEVRYAVLLRDCTFDEPPALYGARVRQFSLTGSRLPALHASDSQVDGLLWLRNCRLDGPLQLVGTRIDGTLSLRSARLAGVEANALTVVRNIDATDAEITGEVMLHGVHVGGTCVLNGARLSNPGAVALNADGIELPSGLHAEALTADGEVRLPDARIGRRLVMTGARLSNPGGTALDADRARIDGAAVLDAGFRADGKVSMRSAVIGGTLLLSGADLDAPGGTALNARLISVGSSLRAADGFRTRGRVCLDSATVQGAADFTGAHLADPGGQALSLCRAEVTGGLAGGGLRADGEIRLLDTVVGASVEFGGARLSNPGGRSLTGYGLTVSGVLNCHEGFTADGRVSLAGARAGELDFDDATINGFEDIALGLRRVRAEMLWFTRCTLSTGTVDLRHARIDVLRDDPARWPPRPRLDGFVYQTLDKPGPLPARLAWLDAADGYHPQPYEQLATVFQGMGRDAEARTVRLAKQRRRRRTLGLPARAWGVAQDWTVGYGYRPLRAGALLAALLLIGTLVFAAHHPLPLKKDEAPAFNPFLYTLDLLLPIISFGQELAFNPRGPYQWLAAALIASGWILATTIAAGITRVLSRQ